MNKVTILELRLHEQLVGYLAGFSEGSKNVLLFAESFRGNPERLTLGLVTHPAFPNSTAILSQDWVRHLRLYPLLSNLLPEGSLRELLTKKLKTYLDNEFQLFATLGHDLPGALVATALPPDQIPDDVLYRLQLPDVSQVVDVPPSAGANKFSLAGVQMKFSMKAKDGRFVLTQAVADGDMAELGDWIVKTPSTVHDFVPLNEFTAMSLASLAGVDIPEIKLVEMSTLDNLPPIKLPLEQYAFAIKRFDRMATDVGTMRVHMEDFAQVLAVYPQDKYDKANYEQIGRVLYLFSGDSIADTQQFARRLLVNILLANGDAHLKNWSLYYPDQRTSRLSPAYDIVTTSVYIEGEREFALNLADNKNWYFSDMWHFQQWAESVGVPWRVIKPHLDDVIEKARRLWPDALAELPMIDAHKDKLRAHWQRLSDDFRIEAG